MVNKSLYYAEINKLDPMTVAPSYIDGVLMLNVAHADAINAIDDNVVEAWKQKQAALLSLSETDIKTIRALEDVIEMMRVDGKWSDQDPRLTAAAKDRLSLRRGNRTIVSQVSVALADGDIDSEDAGSITGEQTTFWSTLKGLFT